jgi:hypothetical protein
MRFARTEKQKDNVAKFLWDTAKVAVAVFGVGAFAKPESMGIATVAIGLLIGLALAAVAYIIDGREVHR